jgi:hypothetical protein
MSYRRTARGHVGHVKAQLSTVVIVVCSITFVSCIPSGESRYDRTKGKVDTLAAIMRSINGSHHDIASFTDVDGILDMACRAGICEKGVDEWLMKDEWNNPFVWRVCRASNGDVRVAVISCGPNGRYENGAGDDIMFELLCHAAAGGTGDK